MYVLVHQQKFIKHQQIHYRDSIHNHVQPYYTMYVYSMWFAWLASRHPHMT